MNIGEKLLQFRKQKGLSQDAVSKKLNVPKSKLSKWEKNELRPEIDDVLKLCDIYEITPNDLLAADKKRKKILSSDNKKYTKMMIDEIITIVTVILYLFVSFLTGAWHITWIIWIIYILILEVVKLVFHLHGIDFDDEDDD